jgi:PAS domain S-box-containing protein
MQGNKSENPSQINKWLSIKRFMLIFLPFAAVLGSILFLFYKTDIKAEKVVLENNGNAHVIENLKAITGSFRNVISDLLFLSKQHELIQLIEKDDRFDIEDLKNDYLQFSKQKGIYDQIRYLDETGMEIIRINYNDGNPSIVPDEKLQPKSHRYYFKEAIVLDKGDVYLSQFDLNIEKKQIELPLKPMIRIATPVFDSLHQKKGMLILNYLGVELFESFANISYPEQISLLNYEGYWLYSHNPDDAFAFMYEDRKDRKFSNRYRDAWSEILKYESGQFYNKKGLFTFAKVFPFYEAYIGRLDLDEIRINKNYYWTIVLHVPTKALNALSNIIFAKYIEIYVVLLLLFAVGAWIFAKMSISRKLAEEALRESENVIRLITDSAHDAIIMIDNDGNISYWNEAAKEIFGYEKEEVIGENLHNLLVPEKFHERHLKAFKNFQQTGQGNFIGKTVELTAIDKNKLEFPIEISVSAVKIKGNWNAISVVRDITQRKYEEEEKKKNYLNLVRIMIVAIGIDQKVTFINKEGCKILGYSEEEIIGKNWLDNFIPKRYKKLVKAVFENLISGKYESLERYDNPILTKNGEERIVQWNNIILKDNEGNITGTLSSGQDITEKRIAEEEKQDLLHDLEERIKELNGLYSLGKLTEKSGDLENIINTLLRDIIPPSMQFPDKTIAKIELDSKEYHSSEEDFVVSISSPIIIARKKRGELTVGYTEDRPFIEHFDQKLIDGYTERLGRFIEKSEAEEEKQNLWSQLLQAQKMESVGRLTGGIAHDFNNLLTAVLGYSELALRDIPDKHPAFKKIEIIMKSGEKGARLIRQLLAFSRKQVLDMKLNNLNTIIDSMSKLLTRMIGEDIALELNIKSPVKNVIVDDTQMEQILMNLVVNARDAMHGGGRLTIETKNVEIDKEFVQRYQGIKPGDYVMLSVADTGCGMPPEVKDKIFEPFFTTKEKGEGTGLGLSTVFGIVNQHKGFIVVDSEPGRGTTFGLYFPVAKVKALEIKREKAPIMKGGTETILVVDDDYILRELAMDILKPLKYNLLEAKSGEEALKISGSYEDEIDLLLTDVVMTGMDGWELAEELKKTRPGIKVVFTSGYAENPIVLQNIMKQKVPFVNKPFTPRVMVNKLREVLDGGIREKRQIQK